MITVNSLALVRLWESNPPPACETETVEISLTELQRFLDRM